MLASTEPDLARRASVRPPSGAPWPSCSPASRYDLVQVEGIELAPYLGTIRARTNGV